MEEKNYPEIDGLEEILERYINPLNMSIYMEIFSIFIKDENMKVISSINQMIAVEENLEQSEITLLIKTLTARQALLLIKTKYGIILDIDETEFKLNDILTILSKLEYLVDIDKDRASEYLDIIANSDTEKEAITEILLSLGIDEFFLLEHFDKLDYGYLKDYTLLLRDKVDNSDEEFTETDLSILIEFSAIVKELKEVSGNYRIRCLQIALNNNSFLTEEVVLKEINEIDMADNSGLNYLAIEFLSAILLAKLDKSLDLVTVYKEDILPGLDLSIKEQEDIFKILSRYYIDIKNKLRGVASATAGL